MHLLDIMFLTDTFLANAEPQIWAVRTLPMISRGRCLTRWKLRHEPGGDEVCTYDRYPVKREYQFGKPTLEVPEARKG